MKENDNPPDALAFAFKLLSLRSHSRVELEQKLLKKGCDTADILRAMDKLSGLGLIDDRSFAMELIRSRSRRKPAGRLRMRYELKKKGVEDSISDELLRDYDGSELCMQAAERKIPSLRGGSAENRKRKLERFLHNRGFDWQDIQKALKLLPEEAEDDEPAPDDQP